MHRLWFVVLLVPTPLWGQGADEKKDTLRFLTSLQQSDGGFVAGPAEPRRDTVPKSSLRATSAAVRAIKYLGGEVPNKEKSLVFVKSCYVPASGAFLDTPGGKADLTATSIGMMAMAALQPDFALDKSARHLAENARTFEERRLAVAGMEAAGRFAPEVKEWLAAIEQTRNPDGTYGTGDAAVRDTGGVVAMILRSGGQLSDEHRRRVVAALRDGQRPDGGFGKADATTSDMESTYRVMRAFHLLKEKPNDVGKLRAFVARHRNADGGYGTAPGHASSVGGTYYAAVIGYWLEK